MPKITFKRRADGFRAIYRDSKLLGMIRTYRNRFRSIDTRGRIAEGSFKFCLEWVA